MPKIVYAKDITAKELVSARNADYADVEETVKAIISDVRARGDEALIDYARRFDKAEIPALKVSEEEISRAMERVGADYIRILERAAENIERYHRAELRSDFELKYDGITAGQLFLPLESAGIYVPGGTARYPSSVLMNAIPARIAGVKNIVMTTPPASDGSIPDNILAAARVA